MSTNVATPRFPWSITVNRATGVVRARVATRKTPIAVLAACGLLLTGCSAALPVVVATSYVAAQTAMAYAPDSLDQGRRPWAGR